MPNTGLSKNALYTTFKLPNLVESPMSTSEFEVNKFSNLLKSKSPIFVTKRKIVNNNGIRIVAIKTKKRFLKLKILLFLTTNKIRNIIVPDIAPINADLEALINTE